MKALLSTLVTSLDRTAIRQSHAELLKLVQTSALNAEEVSWYMTWLQSPAARDVITRSELDQAIHQVDSHYVLLVHGFPTFESLIDQLTKCDSLHEHAKAIVKSLTAILHSGFATETQARLTLVQLLRLDVDFNTIADVANAVILEPSLPMPDSDALAMIALAMGRSDIYPAWTEFLFEAPLEFQLEMLKKLHYHLREDTFSVWYWLQHIGKHADSHNWYKFALLNLSDADFYDNLHSNISLL